MRARAATVLLPLALLALAGCGGLQNEPLTVGVVRGQLAEAASGQAVVSIFGQPDVFLRPNGSGEFQLDGVPQGAAELFAVANESKALRLPLVVHGGGVTDLGRVQPRPGGFVRLQLHTGSYQRLGTSKINVVGTPYQRVSVTDTGEARIGPLPEGCYALDTTAPGFGNITPEICVRELDALEVEAELPHSDGTQGREGCLVTGCQDPYVCMSDGHCESP